MSVSILKVKNPTTGEWKEIPVIVGPTGPAGPQGKEGAQGETGPVGKNAYEYAQEGGYTGTEEEFANKLAKDNILYVDFTDNGDGTYQASKNVVEVQAAHATGIDIKARLTYDSMPLIVPIFLIGETFVGYGGASDNMTIYILHQGVVARVNVEELALQDDMNSIADAVNEIYSLLGNNVPAIDNANVGQILSVASVDENNAPNSWQAIDLPSGDIYYVDMTPVSETEATPSKTFVEVLEAYKSGKDVRAKLNGTIIPLGMNLNDSQLVYAATGSIYSYFISQTPDSDIAQFSITNMATEQYVNDAIANLSIDGGDTLEFIKTIKLTEEVSTIKINTDADGNPLNLKRIVVAVRIVGGTPNEDRSTYWVHPNSINAGAIRIDVVQGVYAASAAVSSVIDIQMITDGVYLLNSSCNGTPKQTWGSYIQESAIKEINFGVSTTDYTFGVNTYFHIMGVKV